MSYLTPSQTGNAMDNWKEGERLGKSMKNDDLAAARVKQLRELIPFAGHSFSHRHTQNT